MSENLKDAMANCDEPFVMEKIQEMLDSGISAEVIVDVCNAGMIALGERFDHGDAFIPDLMLGGMIMKKVMLKLQPLMTSENDNAASRKTIIIGTVQHDIHDIGKDITAMVFRSSGFNVIDLGVDVSPEQFIEGIRIHRPHVLGMSLLLTTCYKSVMDTMEAIRNANLRNSVKICVGGAAASELMAKSAGIDFYAKTAIEGLTWAAVNS
ncbi:MAG: cobalamin-dependent protein [Planctomycetaceae bacterium]|jgi:5-methyltetrahydrofolate--homocysteine methyltransferase|nr:cobalamin-dependent protein [Planctomycetaceae bacterium]